MPNISECSDIYCTDENGTEHALERLYYGNYLIWEQVDSYDITIEVTNPLTIKLEGFTSSVKPPYADIYGTVDWGDGTIEENLLIYYASPPPTHTYTSSGIFTIKIITNGIGSIYDILYDAPKATLDCIRKISFPKSIERVGVSYELNNITSISFKEPSNLKQVWYLSGVKSPISIALPKGTKEISDSAFFNSGLKNIILPNSLEIIGKSSFYRCKNLEKIAIPPEVTELGASAFQECTSLKSVEFSEGLITMKGYTFQQCTSLEKIKFPATLTNIANFDFNQCTNLKSIDFNNSNITIIPSNYLSQCYSLETIILSNKITTIGENACYHCLGLKTLKLPDELIEIKSSAFYCQKNETSGYLYNISLTELILPSKLKIIGDSAFCGFKALKSLIIPDSVTTIGSNAFYKCESITYLEIGVGVSSIGSSAFSNLNNLKSVIIKCNIPNIGYPNFGSVGIGENGRIDGFIIYGIAGSASEAYAKRYNFTFIPI